MALIKSIRGNLVEKVERSFEDGTRGFFCTIVREDETLMSFWCKEDAEGDLGEVQEVEGYSAPLSRIFTLRAREWNGKTKYSMV